MKTEERDRARHLRADEGRSVKEIAQVLRVSRSSVSRWVFELPASCLRASTVNVYSLRSQRKRRNRLPFGTCRLVVDSTAIIQHISGAIQEYGGFDRAAWLD